MYRIYEYALRARLVGGAKVGFKLGFHGERQWPAEGETPENTNSE